MGEKFIGVVLFYAEKLPQVGAEIKMPEKFAMIPWRHHTEIISKCKSVDEALFYIDRTIENDLEQNIMRFLLELGKGFAYVGRQVELKTMNFEPSYIGQLGFYVTAVDHLLKEKGDMPSIGLLSLSNVLKPIGVAEYKLLPQAEELQKQTDLM